MLASNCYEDLFICEEHLFRTWKVAHAAVVLNGAAADSVAVHWRLAFSLPADVAIETKARCALVQRSLWIA